MQMRCCNSSLTASHRHLPSMKPFGAAKWKSSFNRSVSTASSNGSSSNDEFDFDLFTIGAGSGGVRAARIAAQLGARVAIAELPRGMVSSEEVGGVGGTCVLRGCVPKKLLLQASSYGPGQADAAAFGWRSQGPMEHSWSDLMAAKRQELSRLSEVYTRNLTEAGVQLLQGRATLVGPQQVQVAGKTYKARHVLVATGSTPVKPPFEGSDLCVTSDELLDAAERPRHMAVVGGGYIGCEQAAIFTRFGSKVHLVYRQSMLLNGFDEEVRQFLEGQLRYHGMNLHSSLDIVSVKKQQETPDSNSSGNGNNGHDSNNSGGGSKLQLTLKSMKTGEECVLRDLDMVLLATGRKPRTRGLGLEELGVKLTQKGGIEVNEYNASVSTPWLHALGDVSNRLNLTPVARMEGDLIANTLFGGPNHQGQPTAPDISNVPTAVFTWPPIATVGLTETAAVEKHGRVQVYTTTFRPLHTTMAAASAAAGVDGFAHGSPSQTGNNNSSSNGNSNKGGNGRSANTSAGTQEGGEAAVAHSAEQAFVKVLVAEDSQKVVGVHMASDQAAEIMQGFAVAVKAGITKQQLDSTVGIHPTAAEELVTLSKVTRVVDKKDLEQQQKQPNQQQKQETAQMSKAGSGAGSERKMGV